MFDPKSNKVLDKMLGELELPEGAYEKAEDRYKDIYEWLIREGSSCAELDPHIHPCGSFRLGTVTKPVHAQEEYDLDMGCILRQGVSKSTHTQFQLKKLLGDELELYRRARGIHEKLDEKRRCWRLDYADTLKFHLDVVPCIPEDAVRQVHLRESMILSSRLDKSLAADVARLAVSITDNTAADYRLLSREWLISNPEGFAKWFENRMRTATRFLEVRSALLKSQIDKVPYYQWKTPLQQVIQLLKRHRDTMFQNNPDSKPISVILTTLAARAYQGESDLASALKRVLDDMDKYINRIQPLVPNPVNPAEDFADKWYAPAHAKHRLEENFRLWLNQARIDFGAILAADNPTRIVEAADHGLRVSLKKSEVASLLGVSIPAAAPVRTIHASEPKPWFDRDKK
jgi:hypothetical protein